jgi:hypothetical protein
VRRRIEASRGTWHTLQKVNLNVGFSIEDQNYLLQLFPSFAGGCVSLGGEVDCALFLGSEWRLVDDFRRIDAK